MSDVDLMIEYAAMALLDCDESKWNRMPKDERASVEAEVEDALKSLGLPLETLAALKAGTWTAVPLVPTDDMADAISDAIDCFDDPEGVWGAALSISPSKPETDR